MTSFDIKFSVLMPVYYKDNAEYFVTAFNSIINQTLLPNEILIIEDGRLDEVFEKIILEIEKKYPSLVRIIRLEENIGIGRVRALGMNECQYDYVAFMDSDDISRSDRFEKQINFIKEHSNIDVVGSYITEFNGSPTNIYSKRILPASHDEIYKYGKFRMPVNNPTLLLKRQSVLNAGNYQLFNAFEDYELYARMLKLGYKFANIPDFLVNMRAGQGMMNRRKGIKYFLTCELPCMNAMKKSGYINLKEYVRNVTLKFLLRVIPDWFRNWIYKRFLRK